MFCLKSKRALITGATGGIGRDIAKKLLEAGAELVLSGTQSSKLDDLKEELGGVGHYLPCNLRDKEEMLTLFSRAEAATGPIDILICNAGITRDNLTIRMKEEEWNDVIDVNLSSSFFLNRAALKPMMQRRWGRIINITSIVAHTGNAGQANYTASKAGIVAMSKSLAAEVASRNITVNCVSPGFIKTPMTDSLSDAQKEKIIATIPLKRYGTGEEIATSVLFLASEEASYITGQTLHVNGGMFMA